MFLLLKNALYFFEINEINLLIVYKTRKNRKLKITTKKLNCKHIDLTIKSYFRLKISKMRDLKKSFFTNLRVFSKSSI